jgi:hypothetical protein
MKLLVSSGRRVLAEDAQWDPPCLKGGDGQRRENWAERIPLKQATMRAEIYPRALARKSRNVESGLGCG